MRVAFVVLVVIGVGCVGAPPDPPPPPETDTTAPTVTTPGAESPETEPPQRLPATLSLAWDSAHGLTPVPELRGEMALVPETAATGRTLATNQVQGASPEPWSSAPLPAAIESAGAIELTLTFSSDQRGASFARGVGFSPVGAWVGQPGSFAHFLMSQDAPDTIEAGKTYTLKLTSAAPDPKAFWPAGSSLTIYPILAYEVGPGTLRWHVNAATLSAITLPHEAFDLVAPVATTLAEASGELTPFAGPTTSSNPRNAEVALAIPPETLYLVVELVATAQAGHIDADLTLLSAGTTLGKSNGPTSKETVVLGPSALAKGRDLTALITSSGSPGTFTLKATGYSAS